MERYLEQLIDDFHKIRSKVNTVADHWTSVDVDDEGELEDISYVEKYIYGEEFPISTIIGIGLEYLPSRDKLTEEQAARLEQELEALLEHFNFYLDFPESLPAHDRYKFILGIWNDKHVPMPFGESHIEFCSYDEEKCPFPGHCNSCSQWSAQMKEEEEKQGSRPVEKWEDDMIDDILSEPDDDY